MSGFIRRLADRVEDAIEHTLDRDDRPSTHHECGPITVEVKCSCGCKGSNRPETEGLQPPPSRPTRMIGGNAGTIASPLTVGELHNPLPPTTWPGERKDMFLPFLFLRANPGDTGSRPAVGAFWESPDVLLMAGVDPAAAPDVPPTLGDVALADQPNTVYAHVWNFGNAPAYEVIVEFRWCDPSLGINPVGSHLIGYAVTSLGAKGSGRAHRLVKCPKPWVPQFVNGGHECLLVRVWDTADPLGDPQWDASVNRHLGQRNIHVAQGAPLADQPITINVGPLFGVETTVAVERAAPAAVPWMQLLTGQRGNFLTAANVTGAVGLTLNGVTADRHTVTADDTTIQLGANDAPPDPGTAHVYRVTATANGQAFGGYTAILHG